MNIAEHGRSPAKRLFLTCPLGCAADLRQTGIHAAEGALLRCTACGQLVSACTAAQYQAALGRWNTVEGTLPGERQLRRFRQVARRRLARGLRLLGHGTGDRRLLDVGCSSGAFLAVARDMGLRVTGVEPAVRAAQTARQAGFEVHAGVLEDAAYEASSFDIVTLFELVEHLPAPVPLMRECRRILRPGGILVINTPNVASWTAAFMRGRWEGFNLVAMGGHISFFSPESIATAAARTGLEVAAVETRNVRFFEKGQCSPLRYRAARIGAQLAAWPARLCGKGHDLLVYLRKPLLPPAGGAGSR